MNIFHILILLFLPLSIWPHVFESFQSSFMFILRIRKIINVCDSKSCHLTFKKCFCMIMCIYYDVYNVKSLNQTNRIGQALDKVLPLVHMIFYLLPSFLSLFYAVEYFHLIQTLSLSYIACNKFSLICNDT